MLWGVTYRDNLKSYGANKKMIAFEGTPFYIFNDIEKAIEARDKMSKRKQWAVVVDLETVKIISLK